MQHKALADSMKRGDEFRSTLTSPNDVALYDAGPEGQRQLFGQIRLDQERHINRAELNQLWGLPSDKELNLTNEEAAKLTMHLATLKETAKYDKESFLFEQKNAYHPPRSDVVEVQDNNPQSPTYGHWVKKWVDLNNPRNQFVVGLAKDVLSPGEEARQKEEGKQAALTGAAKARGTELEVEANRIRATDPARAALLDADAARLKSGIGTQVLGLAGVPLIAAKAVTESERPDLVKAQTYAATPEGAAAIAGGKAGAVATAQEPFKVAAQQRHDMATTDLEKLRHLDRMDFAGQQDVARESLENLRQVHRTELKGMDLRSRKEISDATHDTQIALRNMQTTAATAQQTQRAQDQAAAQKAKDTAAVAMEHFQSLNKMALEEQRQTGRMDLQAAKLPPVEERIRFLATTNGENSLNKEQRVLWDKMKRSFGVSDEDATKIAQAVADGDQDPNNLGRFEGPVRAKAADIGLNLLTAKRDTLAINQFLKTQNTARPLRLKQAAEASFDMLDNIEDLYGKWKNSAGVSGYKIFNKANIIKSLNTPGEQGEYAKALQQQIANLNSEFSQVLMGGYAATDESLALSQKNLNEADNEGQFAQALKQMRLDLRIRRNSYRTAMPTGVSEGSKYAMPTQAPEPLTGPTPTPMTTGDPMLDRHVTQ